MGFRFRKSVRVMPGVRLNFSKSGVSTSLGGRGATVNIGKRGVRATTSIPGSGLSYSTTLGGSKKALRPTASSADAPPSYPPIVESVPTTATASKQPKQRSGTISLVVGSVLLGAIAASTPGGWIGWTLMLLAFGAYMRAIGRKSVADVPTGLNELSTGDEHGMADQSGPASAEYVNRYAFPPASNVVEDDRWLAAETGREAHFTYVDAHGEVTDRSVSNWRSVGPHIEGFCLTRRAVRTFRKDRIEDWMPVEG